MQDHIETVHTRTQFQIDRIAFFSDAVIAIGLTLMVLEIKIPELGKTITFKEMIKAYGFSMLLHTLALLMGFLTIGNLWIRHHALFEHVINYNERLIRTNLFFLLTIMLLPISISFLFASNEPQHLQLTFYFINLFLCSFTYSLMLLVIFHKKNNFYSIKDDDKIKKLKNNSYTGSIAFLIVTILVLMNISWFYLGFFIIPIVNIISKRRSKALKKAAK
jgi:uncharacterized membrane protein